MNGFLTPVKKRSQDLSRTEEATFIVVPPLAVDTETGEIINKTPNPILKPGEPLNIDERIQSFKDEVDIYKIIDRAVISGDDSLLKRKVGFFGDVVSLPDNIHDLYQSNANAAKALKKAPADVQKAMFNESMTQSDLSNLIKAQVEAALKANVPDSDNSKGGDVQ